MYIAINTSMSINVHRRQCGSTVAVEGALPCNPAARRDRDRQGVPRGQLARRHACVFDREAAAGNSAG